MTVLPTAILEERNGKKYLPKPVPPSTATLQHHDAKMSPERGGAERLAVVEGGNVRYRIEERTTLYCWECNQRENDLRQARTPVVLRRAKSRLGHMGAA
jgi:hypothetical protein